MICLVFQSQCYRYSNALLLVLVDENGKKARPSSFPSNLPSSFKNVKRKVDKFLKKSLNDRFSVCTDFYDDKDQSFVGNLCSKFNITKHDLENIISSTTSTFELPELFFLSNGIALELFMFVNKLKLNVKDLKTLFVFLQRENYLIVILLI